MTQSSDRLEKAMQDFNARFASDEACATAIFNMMMEAGLLRCSACGGAQLEQDTQILRTANCLTCKAAIWFTRGTLFASAKRLRAFVGILFLADQGILLSASEISRRFHVAVSSALGMLHKAHTVIERHMDGGSETVGTSAFLTIICRRSRNTPRSEHPHTEQQAAEENTKVPELPAEPSEHAKQTIAGYISACKQTFGGISRKYLQKYLAGYWCVQDRQTWPFNAILQACLKHPQITLREMGAYDTPPMAMIRAPAVVC